MFKRDVNNIKDLILKNLRAQGLETPLLQKRLIDSWPEVVGPFIKNQTLFVHLTSPALRSEMMMMRSELVKKLNAHVGSQVIADIRFN